MVLVLCDVADTAALWAARELGARGIEVDVVTSQMLDSALRWRHTVGGDGTSIDIELPDGRRISSDSRVGILNRLSFVPQERLRRVGGRDADYAIGEMQALFLSWLHCLEGPLVNAPSPQGLSGSWRHPSQWVALAASVGLPTIPYRQTCSDTPESLMASRGGAMTAFVIGERVVAPRAIPGELAGGLRRMARRAGVALLGVDFVPSPAGGWETSGASVTPYLPLGGAAIVDALQEVLTA